MFGVGTPELLVVLVLVVLLGVVTALVLRRRGPRPPSSPESRRVAATRAAGVLLGAYAGWQVLLLGSLGVGVMLAPAVLGLVVLVSVALGETLVRPRRHPGVRTASLARRRVRDYAPPLLTLAVGAQLVAMVALLALTTLTATRDDYWDSMRALGCQGAGTTQVLTPYAGSYYSAPLALVLLAVLAVAALAARQVVARPRGSGPTGDDDALRRRSLAVVVSATGIALGVPYLGIALTAGSALTRIDSATPTCAAAWMQPAGVVVLLSVLAAAALLVVCVVVLLLDRARVSAEPTSDRADAGRR